MCLGCCSQGTRGKWQDGRLVSSCVCSYVALHSVSRADTASYMSQSLAASASRSADSKNATRRGEAEMVRRTDTGSGGGVAQALRSWVSNVTIVERASRRASATSPMVTLTRRYICPSMSEYPKSTPRSRSPWGRRRATFWLSFRMSRACSRRRNSGSSRHVLSCSS